MVNIRVATDEDIVKFYGKRPSHSMRAIVGELDGEIIGIAGIFFNGVCIVVFSEILPAARAYPFGIYKVARRIKDMLVQKSLPAVAIADPKVEGSCALLEHLGFYYIASSHSGDIYQWMPTLPDK